LLKEIAAPANITKTTTPTSTGMSSEGRWLDRRFRRPAEAEAVRLGFDLVIGINPFWSAFPTLYREPLPAQHRSAPSPGLLQNRRCEERPKQPPILKKEIATLRSQ
jgi:hypothetical protein